MNLTKTERQILNLIISGNKNTHEISQAIYGTPFKLSTLKVRISKMRAKLRKINVDVKTITSPKRYRKTGPCPIIYYIESQDMIRLIRGLR